MSEASRDENFVPTLLGVSNVDGTTPVPIYADPVTHRLFVDLPGGSGSVTSVSVATANGFAGTVANPTSTPAITLTTSITGILKGNGSAISAVTIGSGLSFDGTTLSATGGGTGTVTDVSFTGGLISVATSTTTPALTVAGTSGGIPYFSSGSTWATSAALAANALVVGGGAGVAPSTITTGANVVTALGVAVGSAGAFVVNGGALGTPSSGTVTNLTGTASININGTVGATTPTTATFTTATINTSLLPDANDGAVLGAAATAFSDLFLASGAVIGFGNGDILLTHSTDALTISNTDTDNSGVILGLYQDSASPAAEDSVGVIQFQGKDSGGTKTNYAFISGIIEDPTDTTENGILQFQVAGGAGDLRLNSTALYPTITNTLALGSATLQWSDLFLAEGAVINFDNGDLTLTQSGNTLTLAGGDLVLAENTSVQLDPSLSADGTYSGITITGTAGATLAFGDLIYLSSVDSRWELVDADSVTTCGAVLTGMCVLAAAGDGSATTILLQGNIRADAAFPTLTVGANVYAGLTPGDIVTTAPSATDDVVHVVGKALTADSIYFNPSQDYITIV